MIIDGIKPVVHLTMNEGSGTPHDSSDYIGSFPGYIGGSAVWSSEKSLTGGASIHFDGSQGHVSLGDSTSLVPASAFSLSIWVYADSITGWHRMISRYTTGGNPEYSYMLATNDGVGRVRFLIYPSSNTGVGVKFITDDVVLTENRWHHVVATYSGGDTRMKIYIDGALVCSTLDPSADTSIPSSIRVSSADTALGSNYGGSQSSHQTWNGNLDEFSLWDVELTEVQVAKLYLYGSKGGWLSLGGVSDLVDFSLGANSNGSYVSAYLTRDSEASNIIVTDDLRDLSEQRSLEVCSGGVEALNVAYIGDDLFAVGLSDLSIKIISMSPGAELPHIASVIPGSGVISGVKKLLKNNSSVDSGIIVATDTGKIRFIDSVSADGTSSSGYSNKSFDISQAHGTSVNIVDIESHSDNLVIIYTDDSFSFSVIALDLITENYVPLNSLPFAPSSICLLYTSDAADE